MSDRKSVPLSKAQKNLLGLWNRELSDKITAVQQLANECFNGRLESIAEDLGLDLKNEKWGFDNQKNEFYPIEPPKPTKEVEPTIPGRKRGRPKKEEIVGEELKEEPEIPAEELKS